jgi:hypothetical protein
LPKSTEQLGEWFDIMLGNPGESDHNTIVLSGIDLVVPLELDLDSDPLHDDEIRLKSETSAFERILLSSDPNATPDPDKHLLLYRFRVVPPGIYRISVKVGETWSDLVVGLVVSKKGAYLGDKRLDDGDPEAIHPPPVPKADEESEPVLEPEELGDFMDINDGYYEGRT